MWAMAHTTLTAAVLASLALASGCVTTSRRPAASLAERVDAVEPLVDRAAGEFGLPADLLLALIWVESRFDREAVSPAGARGLMQLMPGTACDMARALDEDDPDPHDPCFAVRAGAAYLALLRDRFGGDLDVALAAYACGPGRVRRSLRRTGRVPKAGLRYARKVQEARRRFVLTVADGRV